MFFPIFEVNKVYMIGRATVKMSRGNYAQSGSSYEIGLEKTSYVNAVQEEESCKVPSVKFAFVPIKNITEKEKDAVIDVIAIVKDAAEIMTITTKANKSLNKRDLTLIDASTTSIKVTLWGALAESFKWNQGDDNVYAFKGLRVGDYGGRSLSTIGSSTFLVNPDIQEAYELVILNQSPFLVQIIIQNPNLYLPMKCVNHLLRSRKVTPNISQ